MLYVRNGFKVIRAFGTKLVVQRPDGSIVNDDTGVPRTFATANAVTEYLEQSVSEI